MENESAFPNEKFLGLTKLEYTSIEILKAMLSNSINIEQGTQPYWRMEKSRRVKYAIEEAKELLKQLEKDGIDTK